MTRSVGYRSDRVSIRSSAMLGPVLLRLRHDDLVEDLAVDQPFEHPQQVVRRHAEHRRAQAAELIERDARSCRAPPRSARRWTRWTSVPTAHIDPARSRVHRLEDVLGRAAVVGGLHDVERHFGMHDHPARRDASCAHALDLLHGEAHVDRAVALPQDQLRRSTCVRRRGRRTARSDPTPPSGRAARPS